jgi:flagellar motor switch protein FliG
MANMSEDEAALLSREIARLPTITSDMTETVLEEGYQMSMAHDYVVKGGVDYARKVLMNAYGPDQARRLLDRLMKAIGNESASFDALQKADPQQLAKFIHKEHPQTIALVLSHLNSSQGAALLQSLPVELRGEVSLRMAYLDRISPDVISHIAGIIGQKIKSLGEFSREAYGGVRAVAEMFNRLDSGTSKDILDAIESSDSSLTETIRHMMFVFEDILVMDLSGIKEILSRVDRKLLTVALKGTSDQLRGKFLECMSQRGADMLKEDMEALGPVKIKEVDSAQQQIISIVRQLEAEGIISLKGAVGEQYVV